MELVAYVKVKDMTTIVQRPGGGNEGIVLQDSYTFCEVVQYYLKLDSDKLKMHILNLIATTKTEKTKKIYS